MNSNYHYEGGAIHNDNKRVINIGSITGADAQRMLRDFLADGAVDAVVVGDEVAAHEPPSAPSAPPLPAELATPTAMKYWRRLQEAGFVDDWYRLMSGVSRRQAAYIADEFAFKLGLKACFKPFEGLWGKKNLAQEKHHALEAGAKPPRSQAIDAIFAD